MIAPRSNPVQRAAQELPLNIAAITTVTAFSCRAAIDHLSGQMNEREELQQ
jgi:hypothetical protein